MKCKFKIAIRFLAVLLLNISIAQAQDEEAEGKNKYIHGGFAYASYGYTFDFGSELVGDLQSTGIMKGSNLPPFGINVGLGADYLISKNYIIGANLHWLNYQNIINNNNEMTFGGNGGGFSAGYVVYGKFDWLIYPTIGYSMGSSDMSIRNTTDSLLYFGEYELEPFSTSDFNISNSNLDIAINAQKLIYFNNSFEKAFGMFFGIRIGYLPGLSQNNWNDAGGSEVKGLTSDNGSSFYIKLTIGGGGFLLKAEKGKKRW